MYRSTKIIIEQRIEVLTQSGLSTATLQRRINAGLWCPPISLGARRVGFVAHETNELLCAYINNFTESEIKDLVKKLVIERKQLFSNYAEAC